MPVVAEFSFPADAVPLGAVFEQQPDVRIELEEVIPADDAAIPYFWVYDADTEALVDLVERDPEVETLTILSERRAATLVEAEWTPDAAVISGIRVLDPTIMEGTGTVDGWQFQVRAADRESLIEFQRIFSEEGIDVELDRIYGFAKGPESDRALTGAQRETLLAAYRDGYYDDPRRSTQRDLAEQFDISQRAVSNRLRRGTKNLVASSLTDAPDPDEG